MQNNQEEKPINFLPVQTNLIYHKGKLLTNLTNSSFKEIEKILSQYNKLVKKNENKIELVKIEYNPNDIYDRVRIYCSTMTLQENMKLKKGLDDYSFFFEYTKKYIDNNKLSQSIISKALRQASKINKVIPLSKYNVYRNKNRIVGLSAHTMKDLAALIKKKVQKTGEEKEVYIIRVGYEPNNKNPIHVHINSTLIDEELDFVRPRYPTSISFNYSEEELKKYKFKHFHIQAFINAIENNLIDISKDFIQVSKVLK